MSTFETAASILADGVRCTRGGVGLLLGAAAGELLSVARLDWGLLAAARAGLGLGLLGGGALAAGGLPAGTWRTQLICH